MPDRPFRVHKSCEDCDAPEHDIQNLNYKEYKRFVSDVVAEVLSALEAHTILAEQHKADHFFIQDLIEERKEQSERRRRRIEMMDKIKAQIGGWTIISVLSTIGVVAWEGFHWVVVS